MPSSSEAAGAHQPPPPPYEAPVRTVHDETFRGISYLQLSIASLAQVPHLIGHLEHHSPNTDGSFSICIAGGDGVFISQVSTSSTFALVSDTELELNRHRNYTILSQRGIAPCSILLNLTGRLISLCLVAP